jgi:hypothetical protein
MGIGNKDSLIKPIPTSFSTQSLNYKPLDGNKESLGLF